MFFVSRKKHQTLIEAYQQQVRNNETLVLQKPELAEYFTTHSDQYVHGLTLQPHMIRHRVTASKEVTA